MDGGDFPALPLLGKARIRRFTFNPALKMKALADLRVFVSAADLGSLSAAARALDLSPAVASAALKRLESELDTRLFVRSTRSLRPSPEGERFLVHAREALRVLDEGSQALRDDHATLRGELRLSAPSDFGRNLLLPWLDRFLIAHPDLRVRVQLSDRIADIHRHPVDIALRYGPLPDSSLVALPVAATNRRVLVAAPAYLARHGSPSTPAALSSHNCLRFMLSDELHTKWNFTSADGRRIEIHAQGDRASDDGEAVRRWALAGVGIAFKSWLDAASDIRAGRLQVLCADWRGEDSPLYLVSADRRAISPAIQRLHAFLVECCDELGGPSVR